jgi:hypothetical protein
MTGVEMLNWLAIPTTQAATSRAKPTSKIPRNSLIKLKSYHRAGGFDESLDLG